jgi:hypothetical protein
MDGTQPDPGPGPSPDDIAGVVDLFGALTRAELRRALSELAFRQGAERDPEAFEAAIEAAVDSYHLVAVPADALGNDALGDDASGDGGEHDGEADLLVAGPVAFPTLPEGGEDLPHIMDAPDRQVDREAAAAAAEEQFRADAAAAVGAGDTGRVGTLLDVSYELEAWGPVDLGETRRRLDAARDETN